MFRKFVAMRSFAYKIVLFLLRREKRVQQMSAVASDAGEQTLISISTDAV